MVLESGAVAARAAVAASGDTPAGTLPPEGVFESCSLDTELQMCLQRLRVMHSGGMQVVVIPAWGASLGSLGSYAAAANALGMSVMWELSNPTWWRDPATSTTAAGSFAAFAQACGCDQNGPLLAFTISWLSRIGGTYGYYAADDSMLAAGDQAGVASYVSQIKRQDPARTVMIGAYGQPQAAAYQGIADLIGTEIYPVTTASLMPASPNQSTWDWITADAIEAQQSADSAGKQSAFILQAFTWGDNPEDGEAVGVCTDTDTPRSCYEKLAYPTTSDQLQLRNAVLRSAHPQLILWWSFQGTYGQAGDDTYTIYPTGATAAARWSGLATVAQAPFPGAASADPPSTAAPHAAVATASKQLLRRPQIVHPRRLSHRGHSRRRGAHFRRSSRQRSS